MRRYDAPRCHSLESTRLVSQSDIPSDDAESNLRASWSIGPLRPWLMMIAEREMPDDLRGRIEPSDVVQQALLDAWRGESGFHGNSHPQRLAWLRVIMRRVMLQNHRRLLGTKKRGEGAERAIADAIDHSSMRIEQLAVGREPTPEEVVDDAEQNLLIAAALDRLSDDHRHVIQRRHFDHQPYETIAQELNRSPAATRMLWVRALVLLRREIAQLE